LSLCLSISMAWHSGEEVRVVGPAGVADEAFVALGMYMGAPTVGLEKVKAWQSEDAVLEAAKMLCEGAGEGSGRGGGTG
jgi:DUF917 family protein